MIFKNLWGESIKRSFPRREGNINVKVEKYIYLKWLSPGSKIKMWGYYQLNIQQYDHLKRRDWNRIIAQLKKNELLLYRMHKNQERKKLFGGKEMFISG